MQPGQSNFKKVLYIMSPIFLYYGLNLLVSLAFVSGIYVYMSQQGPVDEELLLEQVYHYSYEMTMVMVLLLIPIASRWIHKDKVQAKMLGIDTPCSKTPVIYYPVAFFLGAAACILLNHLLLYSGLTEVYSQNLEDMGSVLYQGKLLVELIGVGIITPIAEELIFRGLLMKRIRRHLGVKLAIFVSSFIFAAMHANFLQGIFAFFMGLLMAYAYERYQKLAAPILLHIGSNLVSVVISETSLMDPVYENSILFWIVTMASAALVVLTIGIIQYRVDATT